MPPALGPDDWTDRQRGLVELSEARVHAILHEVKPGEFAEALMAVWLAGLRMGTEHPDEAKLLLDPFLFAVDSDVDKLERYGQSLLADRVRQAARLDA